ncbi:M14 family metallopeptidase [Microbacterium atlanticum]|uniref:M14 family metallopeptidase n=1 Tax=Microbacterium atlanticum TaxID=2782168 RepID=UPI0018872281|nr:M14 family metallopeptidase [Microbacterium atlanticum]
MFRELAVATAVALVISGIGVGPAMASPPPEEVADDVGVGVYEATVDADGLATIAELGVDRAEGELMVQPGADGTFVVQVVLPSVQAEQVRAGGIDLQPVVDGGAAGPGARSFQAEAVAEGVFRPYLGEGGIAEELAAQAAAYPDIAQLVTFGKTWMGTPMQAVRVTRDPGRVAQGKRPTTVFLAAQHAREWITPEMVRRLLDQVLTSYGSDPKVTDLVRTTEMWFIPVANPDGYDFTFEVAPTPDDPGTRLWRKNLRDNNSNTVIDGGDGVDLNRNSPTRWGYDNEGSSPNPSSLTYRGPSPGSEPESQALYDLFAKITPQFFINYHSAAELLLHGIGWQVATPSPDDVIYEAMVGDDADPAVPGYDPDISAELYTTNGDIDSHMQEAYGTLGFTPEMSTCLAAVASDPDDDWTEADCGDNLQGFDFPDDEQLIQAEFAKNVPFALAVAESAKDPDDPVSVVGRDAEEFRVDTFSVSYGDPQTVAVTAQRALKAKKLMYSINGGRAVQASVSEWDGGERYGFENDDYYAEYRGVVRGAKPGDSVEVWFTGVASANDLPKGEKAGPRESAHFTYEVAQDTGHSVLVVANEDYKGYNPETTPRNNGLKHLGAHVDALLANEVTPDVWDVDAQGVPHDLGVLSHYDAVVWYLGDNRLTQDQEDVFTSYFGSDIPDLAVAERQQYLTIAMRDYLNEGGKVAYDGETTAYYGLGAGLFGGIWYGLDGAPEEDCVVTSDPFSDCLLLADDFTQYWMGAYGRQDSGAQTGTAGVAAPLDGLTLEFGGPATVGNAIDEVGAFIVTSDVLPVDEFPQFASEGAAEYPDPFDAVEGEWAAAAGHIDDGYQRLGRTYDLTALTAANAPAFQAQIGFDLEAGYDNVIVEARPAGAGDDAWTTLPEAGGATSPAVPTECEAGFLLALHPWLLNYLTPGNPCTTPGATGDWNALTGSSLWVPVSYDLSAYAGGQVEIVVSYVTDPATGGLGVIIDDTKLVSTAGTSQAEGFEEGLGAWQVLGAPEDSPENSSDWERADGLAELASVTATEDTLLFGFGLEQLVTPEQRALVVGRMLDHFGL